MNCDKKDLLLYAVTDRAWLNGETLCSTPSYVKTGNVLHLVFSNIHSVKRKKP